MYTLVIYGHDRYGSGAQAREHRDAHTVAPGGAPPPRLRHRTADRASDSRRRAAPRGVALSAALPPGEARLGGRAMGGAGGREAPALLPRHPGGPEGAGGTEGHLAGV